MVPCCALGHSLYSGYIGVLAKKMKTARIIGYVLGL